MRQRGTISDAPISFTKQDFLNTTGFRCEKKNRALYKRTFKQEPPQKIEQKFFRNHFPKKQMKQFQLHHVAPRNAYLIDIIFT